MIWLLLNIAYTASIPSVPCCYSSVNRLGVVKSLGGDTAETTDPGWPKGYVIPCNIMFNDKMKSFSKVAVAQGLAGHLHVGGNFFCINFLLHLLNCLNDNPWVCSLFPSLHHPVGGGSKKLEASYLPAGLNPLYSLNCTVTSEGHLWLIRVIIFSYTSVRCHW